MSGHPSKCVTSFWLYHHSCYTSSKIIQVDMHTCMCAHICACYVYAFMCANTDGHVCLCMCVHLCHMHEGIIGALKKGKRWQIQLSQPPVLLASRDMKPCLLRDEPFYLPKQKMDSAFSGDWADIPSRQELPEARGWWAKVCLTFLIKSKQR